MTVELLEPPPPVAHRRMPNVASCATWSERTYDVLLDWADHPGRWFCVVLFAHLIFVPYLGIYHDARLYSGQVLSHLHPEIYGRDLFFRFGSQDAFSIFSTIMRPLVAWLGVSTAFWIGYAVATSMFVGGALRLTRRLLPDEPIAAMFAGLATVMVPLSYCGLRAMTVHEQFLTSRLMGTALAIWGLSYAIEARWKTAVLWMFAALFVHPLMAVGGWLTLIACWIQVRFGGKTLAWMLVGSIAFSAMLFAMPSVASRFLKTVDPVWEDAILRSSWYQYPSRWWWSDWANLGISGLLLLLALLRMPASPQRSFLTAVGLVSVLALVGTLLANALPYALLKQGQPYRALWIIALLRYPLAVRQIVVWLREGTPVAQMGAVVLFGCLGSPLGLFEVDPRLVLMFFAGIYLVGRGLRWLPAKWGIAIAAVLAIMTWQTCVAIRVLVDVSANLDLILEMHEVREMLTLLTLIGPAPVGIALVMVLTMSGKRFAPAVAVGCVAIASIWFAVLEFVPRTAEYRSNWGRFRSDGDFVKQTLATQMLDHPATIYSDLGRLDLIWTEWHARSYYDWHQTGGFVFSRESSMEGMRRAPLVRPFEFSRIRHQRDLMREEGIAQSEAFFGAEMDETPEPTVEDLRKLCSDPEVDYVVSRLHFPGQDLANNGRVYIYDAAAIRGR
ncbi:MAG: hypothetical protein U0744_21515 [Gemmataceae bacterium]